MKKAITKTASPALAQTDPEKQEMLLAMARLRLEMAETRWAETKEQAREARRQRKKAKALAREAKKVAKQARAELAEARSMLAEAEANLASTVVPAAKARKGPPGPSVTPAVSVPVATETAALDPETGASTAPAHPATIEQLPKAAPHSTSGNWR